MYGIELFVTKCPLCNKDVTTCWQWDDTGCISSKEYDLIGDWAVHSECWDRQVENE